MPVVVTAPTGIVGYSNAVLQDGPVSYWRLGELSGTVAYDLVGGNPGTYTGGFTLGAAGPLVGDGSAVTLNGTTGYIPVPDAASLRITGDLTLEAWVKPTNRAAIYAIAMKAGVSLVAAPYAFILLTSGLPYFRAGNGATQTSVLATVAPTVGVWSHVVVTVAGNTVTHYLNGVVNGTGSIAGQARTDGGNAFTIGGSVTPGTYSFLGSLDEVAVYNTALSAARILAHYNASLVAPHQQVEGLVFGGVDLNSGPISTGNYSLEAIDFTPPPKKPEWAVSADSDGQSLVRAPLFDNRTITARIRVEPQSSMDQAIAAIGVIVDQCQEAEKQAGGVTLVWTPAQSSKSVTFYVITASVSAVPIMVDGGDAGWFVKSPLLTVVFTCKPFGYGPEVSTGAPVSSGSNPYVTVTAASVQGDVPAEGRLVLTDTASQNRRFVEWGLENRFYNAATNLFLANTALTATGGASTTRAGSQGANVIRATLPFGNFPTSICTTGVQSHVGVFRVRARVWASVGTSQVRLTWADGDGVLRPNAWVTPAASAAFADVDLGLITITPTASGTQKWVGQIEGMSSAGGDTLDVDYLLLIPSGEGYGKARATPISSGAYVTASDAATTGAGNLAGRTPGTGQTWATAGATTDFQQGALSFSRTAISDATPRFATFTNAQTDTYVIATLGFVGSGAAMRLGVLARYVDTSNYIAAYQTFGPYFNYVGITVVVGGGVVFGQQTLAPSLLSGVTLSVSATGSIVASWTGGPTIAAQSTAAAVGGALATGKAGLYDQNPSATASTRTYLNVSAGVPSPEQIALYSGRTLEVRSGDTLRQDSTGVYYGRPALYRGSRFFVPQAGSAGRTSRIIARATRNDLEVSADANLGDSFTAQAFVTPRYHVIPR